MQIEAGTAMNLMLRENIIENEEIIKSIHKVACQIITTWSPDVLEEWRQTFVLSMRGLNNLEIKSSIDKALAMCDKTQPLVTRISGAYVLGKIVRYFNQNQLPIGWS